MVELLGPQNRKMIELLGVKFWHFWKIFTKMRNVFKFRPKKTKYHCLLNFSTTFFWKMLDSLGAPWKLVDGHPSPWPSSPIRAFWFYCDGEKFLSQRWVLRFVCLVYSVSHTSERWWYLNTKDLDLDSKSEDILFKKFE